MLSPGKLQKPQTGLFMTTMPEVNSTNPTHEPVAIANLAPARNGHEAVVRISFSKATDTTLAIAEIPKIKELARACFGQLSLNKIVAIAEPAAAKEYVRVAVAGAGLDEAGWLRANTRFGFTANSMNAGTQINWEITETFGFSKQLNPPPSDYPAPYIFLKCSANANLVLHFYVQCGGIMHYDSDGFC